MSRPTFPLFEFVAKNGVSNFVETGLWHGDGVATALQAGFETVYSFDIVQELIDECSERFAKPIADGKVKLVLGDSGVVLPETISGLNGPTLYWLDAHFQGIEVGFEAENCPLQAEITAIKKRAHPADVVLIDDLRLLKDKKAWRGHETEIDRLLGDLLLTFPDSIGFMLEGHVKHDVFCMMPVHLAKDFFAKFPSADLTHQAQPKVNVAAIQTSTRKPIYVSSGGHNSRLGNLLPVYARLLLKAGAVGKPVSFPFLEKAASDLFDFKYPPLPSNDFDEITAKRVIRAAQELIEKREGVGSYDFTRDVVHEVTFEGLGICVMFGRGHIDWDSAFKEGKFDRDELIILDDPFPFKVDNFDTASSINLLTPVMSVKVDLFENVRQILNRETNRDGAKIVCFHWRQGDFANWQNGAYSYTPDLMAEVIACARRVLDANKVDYQVVVVSDGEMHEANFDDDVITYGGDAASCFALIAHANYVFSNTSTFSRTASAVGSAFLGNGSRYATMGTSEEALERIEKLVGRIVN